MEGNKLASAPKRELAIFYIERTQAFLYGDGMASPAQLDFPVEIITDLEVISREKLDALLQAFIEVNKITPKNIVLLLAKTVTFEKAIPVEAAPQADEEMQKFLEVIPFEHVISKVYRINKTVKLVAANKDFCDSFRRAFLSHEFQIVSLIPFCVVQEVFVDLAGNVDLSLLLKKIDVMKQYTLLTTEETSSPVVKEHEKKTHSQKLIVMIAVCALVFGLLLYVVAHAVLGIV